MENKQKYSQGSLHTCPSLVQSRESEPCKMQRINSGLQIQNGMALHPPPDQAKGSREWYDMAVFISFNVCLTCVYICKYANVKPYVNPGQNILFICLFLRDRVSQCVSETHCRNGTHWLCWNLLCRPGWPPTQRFA